VNGKESIEVASISERIGNMYSKQKNYKQALEWYNRSLSMKEKLTGDVSIERAFTLNNIGDVYK